MANSIDTDVLQDGQLVRSVVVQEGTVLKSGGQIDTKALVQTDDGAQLCDKVYIVGGGGSSITVDDSLSSSSENPVQNKVITAELNDKQDTLTAGTGISIQNNVISTSGSTITVDDALSLSSENPVQNKVITAALDDKQDKLEGTVYTTDNLIAGTNITFIYDDGPATTTVTDFNNGCIAIPWVNPTSSLELIVHGTMPSSYTSGQNYGLLEAGAGLAIQKYSNDSSPFRSWASDSNSNSIWANQALSYYYEPSAEYWLKIVWDGTNYSFWYKNLGVWEKYGSNYQSASAIYSSDNKLYLGQYYFTGRTTSNMQDGEIYLHDCSLSVDGNVVFNGATAVRGTDYTVVGTPTITMTGGGKYKINNTIDPTGIVYEQSFDASTGVWTVTTVK